MTECHRISVECNRLEMIVHNTKIRDQISRGPFTTPPRTSEGLLAEITRKKNTECHQISAECNRLEIIVHNTKIRGRLSWNWFKTLPRTGIYYRSIYYTKYRPAKALILFGVFDVLFVYFVFLCFSVFLSGVYRSHRIASQGAWKRGVLFWRAL